MAGLRPEIFEDRVALPIPKNFDDLQGDVLGEQMGGPTTAETVTIEVRGGQAYSDKDGPEASSDCFGSGNTKLASWGHIGPGRCMRGYRSSQTDKVEQSTGGAQGTVQGGGVQLGGLSKLESFDQRTENIVPSLWNAMSALVIDLAGCQSEAKGTVTLLIRNNPWKHVSIMDQM